MAIFPQCQVEHNEMNFVCLVSFSFSYLASDLVMIKIATQCGLITTLPKNHHCCCKTASTKISITANEIQL